MRLSYIIVSYNRREALLRTLGLLYQTTPLPPEQWETWVVDNASTDGSVQAVREFFPQVQIIQRSSNEGVCARSYAFGPARGQYVILLDDDSYPIEDTALRSMEYLDSHPQTAAVVGRVLLPDGSAEACAMPTVMLSGAVCIRKSVLDQVGGFRKEFFRKAGEYDFSFRIWQAGYRVDRFEDLIYRHDKVMTGRSAAFAHRMDLRNNLILVERYLPPALRREYRRDWTQRYSAIARHAGCAAAARQARWEGRLWALREACTGRQILSSQVIETIFELDKQKQAVAQWASQHGVRRVLIADFSKTLYSTHQACLQAGLTITAIADKHPAFAGQDYRGLPILADDRALADRPDGIILSNVNPAQVDRRLQQLRASFDGPILSLWQPQFLRQPVSSTAAA